MWIWLCLHCAKRIYYKEDERSYFHLYTDSVSCNLPLSTKPLKTWYGHTYAIPDPNTKQFLTSIAALTRGLEILTSQSGELVFRCEEGRFIVTTLPVEVKVTLAHDEFNKMQEMGWTIDSDGNWTIIALAD